MAITMTLTQFVELVGNHEPVSPNRLVELTGYRRQDIDRLIRSARDPQRRMYIADFGPSPFGGNRTVKLYARGDKPDAVRPYVKKKTYRRKRTGTPHSRAAAAARRERAARLKRETQFVPRRDPFTEAFFGPAS
jgi:hypothetical protein